MGDTARNLRGLILSATELKQIHPEWSDAFIEDYLNIYNNLVNLADEIDTKALLLKTTERVTSSSFTITDEDEIFADTTTTAITLSLPEGIDGRRIRIHNLGEVGNNVTLVPDGTDLLFGVNNSEVLYDTEVVFITYETDSGWD